MLGPITCLLGPGPVACPLGSRPVPMPARARTVLGRMRTHVCTALGHTLDWVVRRRVCRWDTWLGWPTTGPSDLWAKPKKPFLLLFLGFFYVGFSSGSKLLQGLLPGPISRHFPNTTSPMASSVTMVLLCPTSSWLSSWPPWWRSRST